MNRLWIWGFALSGAMAAAITPQSGSAQQFARYGYPPRVARNVYQARGQAVGPAVDAAGQMPVEELPPGHMDSGQAPAGGYGDPFADEQYGAGEFHAQGDYPYGQCDGGAPACGDGCCQGGYNAARCYVFGEYLNIEAGFSDALGFVDNQLIDGTTLFEHHQLDFDFTSSYRFGGGYRIGECGEEIRFVHSRLRSKVLTGFTSEFVGNQPEFLIPFKPPQFDGGPVVIGAEADVRSYDLDVAKTVPLGCKPCCDCGDACGGECGGCCDPCATPCPLWDVTWSLGVRYTEADWYRRWTTFNTEPEEIGGALSTMDFEGVGPRVGTEARRYFFDSGWLSAYAKADISLLWGELEFATVSRNALDTGVPTQTVVTREGNQLIPVTEIEAGFGAQVTCQTRITGGYLVSAWHDLGYRDDFLIDPGLTFPLVYDDANILAFHGWFFRAEVSY